MSKNFIMDKINEILVGSSKKDFKSVNNHIKDFKKKKTKNKFGFPFYDFFDAVIQFYSGNIIDAKKKCNSILDKKLDEDQDILSSFVQFYAKNMNCYGETAELLYALFEKNPKLVKSEELSCLYLNCRLIMQEFAKAQAFATKSYLANKTQKNLQMCVFCCYMQALSENSKLHYKLTSGYIGKLTSLSLDFIDINFHSLINVATNDEELKKALDFITSDSVTNTLSYDKLSLYRFQIEIYTKLHDFRNVSLTAEKILREVHNDSIDEWRLIVNHSMNPQDLINEFKSSYPLLRGPLLAEIELAIKNSGDVSKLIAEYCKRYENKPYLFGDVSQYSEYVDKSEYQNINDKAVHLLLTGEVIGEVTSSREASIFSQYYYLNEKDSKKAINICKDFASNPDVEFMLIRLSGIIGLTNYQARLVGELRIDAILLLSLGNIFICDLLKNIAFTKLASLATTTIEFVNKSNLEMLNMIDMAVLSDHYLVINQGIKMKNDINDHINLYFSQLFIIFYTLLQKGSIPQIELKSNDEIEKLLNRIDYSVLPCYINSDECREFLYPSVIEVTKGINSVIHACFSIIDGKEPNTRMFEGLSEWEKIGTFIDGKYKLVETDSPIILACFVLLANLSNNSVSGLSEKLDSTLESLKNNVLNNRDLFFVSDEYIEEQNSDYADSVNLLKNLLI